MIKGLYAAASAMLAGVHQQSVLAHNVANMDTPGFKQVMVSLDDFYATPVVQPRPEIAGEGRPRWIGDLGLGVETAPEVTDHSEGALRSTGQPLDLAIQGSGFFRVRTPAGERYTRDGRFSRDAEGQLVSVDGHLVLDDGGQPITLEGDGPFTVTANGAVFAAGEQVTQIGLAIFADPAALAREGDNTFAAAGQPDGGQDQPAGVIVQGYLEAANVNPAQLMTQMVQVARHYEAAQQMVQTQDELLGRAISSLGRL